MVWTGSLDIQLFVIVGVKCKRITFVREAMTPIEQGNLWKIRIGIKPVKDLEMKLTLLVDFSNIE